MVYALADKKRTWVWAPGGSSVLDLDLTEYWDWMAFYFRKEIEEHIRTTRR